MSIPISNVARRVVFAPSGVGPYSFTFEILAATDIQVFKGDTLLTLTTDYTVTINTNGTGSVTLVATAGTDNITIVGARAIQRTTDFVTGGDLFASTLNTELDSLTIFTQQNAEANVRSIKAPVTDPTTINMTLPSKTDRASKYLAFNSLGDPIATAGTSETSPISSAMAPVVSASTLSTARTAMGLGSMATQNANNVAITGGSATLAEVILNGNNISADNSLGFRNRIINGGFDIAQRGTSFVSGANNDDTYNLDRWYVLSDGNDAVDITQTTTVPTGAKFSIGLDVETTNKKFGIAQIIENANCFDAIGQTVTLSFDAKVSSTTKLDNVKCAIVAWSGTADSVTSDIISAWNVEGTNPTLIANATYENSPANLNVTTSFARYTVSAAVDTSNTTNIIVFIWSDVTDTTAGDFLYITNVQLEAGSVATPFERRPYGTELSLCQRYYQKITETLYGSNANVGYAVWTFKVSMRAAPTVTGNTGTIDWNTTEYVQCYINGYPQWTNATASAEL